MLYLFLNSHKDIVSAFIHKLFCVCLMFCRGLDIFLVYHEYTRNHIPQIRNYAPNMIQKRK